MIEKLGFLTGHELREDTADFINEDRRKINELVDAVNLLSDNRTLLSEDAYGQPISVYDLNRKKE